jgi:hypothetical protein
MGFQLLTLLSYGYLSMLHKSKEVKRKWQGNIQRNQFTVVEFIWSWDEIHVQMPV